MRLFPGARTAPLAPRTYVLCDVFGTSGRKVRLTDGKMVTPGTPILYYKANPASLLHDPPNRIQTSVCIYDARDNAPIRRTWAGWPMRPSRWCCAEAAPAGRRGMPAPRASSTSTTTSATRGVQDRRWPIRPDSYLLISAGMDGIYGTEDDIRNFGQ